MTDFVREDRLPFLPWKTFCTLRGVGGDRTRRVALLNPSFSPGLRHGCASQEDAPDPALVPSGRGTSSRVGDSAGTQAGRQAGRQDGDSSAKQDCCSCSAKRAGPVATMLGAWERRGARYGSWTVSRHLCGRERKWEGLVEVNCGTGVVMSRCGLDAMG